ncbi:MULTISPECIES: FGGY family carbohydrate kinase [unclassified Mycobacterium]|uniref:FGGY family carbohydrate kinase n=1 Tax=unclassified Mycobacterium TaxID=2642494 RepID=UPI0029C8B6CC|nr:MULTISPECIES: FGGY family carbohydrate kinase [unclassified Mycobacterium]
MHDDVLIGIDIGSSGTKALAYDRAGVVVAARTVPTPTRRSDGGLDFPVLDVLAAAEQVLAEVVATVGPVAGVGIASMGEVGTILTDRQLADLHFPAWYDDRGADVVAALEASYGRRELATVTGGHARATSTIAKLGWLAAHRGCPPGTFLGVAGALAWRLTGAVTQEAGLASTSGAFDPVGLRYLPALWNAAGLRSVTPPGVEPAGTGKPAGATLARTLGLRPSCPVVIAGHDHPVAAVGTGAAPGDVVDSVGTSEGLLVAMSREQLAKAAGPGPLVADGFTIETWPGTADLVVMAEGLRPGLAMQTLLEESTTSRAALDAAAPPPGIAPDLDRSESLALERGELGKLRCDPLTWASVIDHYARLAADQEAALRADSAAAGRTVLTGGGTRSTRWMFAKHWFGAQEPVISDITETVTRGGAAIVGAALGWWPDAAAMPGTGSS